MWSYRQGFLVSDVFQFLGKQTNKLLMVYVSQIFSYDIYIYIYIYIIYTIYIIYNIYILYIYYIYIYIYSKGLPFNFKCFVECGIHVE